MASKAENEASINTDGLVVSDYVHPHSVNAGIPIEEIKPPSAGKEFEVDEAVLDAFPLPNTTLVKAHHYGSSLWGKIAKLVTKLEDGSTRYYFLKIIPFDNPGKQMCQGEFESLKAMYAIVPTFIPRVYNWGPLKSGPGYFLLAEFREVGQQPPDPHRLTMRVAELHYNSKSPNGKFGFHVPTFHGNLPTYTDWEESWTVMYTKILARAMDIDQSKSDPGPTFTALRRLLFNHVIPRLLDPLSSQGRSIKPCLVHGDLWDENCAIDMATGEPFAFDAGSLYAHNEYEIGYWRPPRHRLSNKAYARSYKRFFPVSEPADEWDDRNLLYSMRYNIGLNVLIPSSGQRAVVLEDMKTLCRKYCYRELSEIEGVFNTPPPGSVVDQEELEYDDEETRSNLDNTAAEMGLRTDDLVAGLHDNNGGDQAMPTEKVHEDSSDREHHPEPDQSEKREESQDSNARRPETQISETSATEADATFPSDAQRYEPQVAGTPTAHVSATGIQTQNLEAEEAKASSVHAPEVRIEEDSIAQAHRTGSQPMINKSDSTTMQDGVAEGADSGAISGEGENKEKPLEE